MFQCFYWFSNVVISWMISCSNLSPQQQNWYIANLDPSSWPWTYTLLSLFPMIAQLFFFAFFSGSARDRISICKRPWWVYTPLRFVVLITFVSQFVAGMSSVVLVLPASQPTGWTTAHTVTGFTLFSIIVLHLVIVPVLGHCYSNGETCGCRIRTSGSSSCCGNRGKIGNWTKHGFNWMALFIMCVVLLLLQLVIMFGSGLVINGAFSTLSFFGIVVTLYSLANVIVFWSRNRPKHCATDNSFTGFNRYSGLGQGNGAGCNNWGNGYYN